MPIFQKEVHSFDELIALMDELGDSKKSFVVFTGSLINGKSWCPDCVVADPVIHKTLGKLSDSNLNVITCYVGDLPTWRNPANPFRTHDKIKLTCVPTMLDWSNKRRRLTEEQLTNEALIKDLLLEDD